VARALVVLEHHALHLRWHHRNLGVASGEGADRLQRLPARDDQELDAAI